MRYGCDEAFALKSHLVRELLSHFLTVDFELFGKAVNRKHHLRGERALSIGTLAVVLGLQTFHRGAAVYDFLDETFMSLLIPDELVHFKSDVLCRLYLRHLFLDHHFCLC